MPPQEKRKPSWTNLIDQLPGPFYIFTKEGKFIRWNKRHEAISGYSTQECASMPPLNLFGHHEYPAVHSKIEAIFQIGHGTLEVTLLTKDGRKLPHLYLGVRITLNGKPALMGFGIDISVLKETEQDLQEKKMALLKKTISQEQINETLKNLLDQREIEKNKIEQSMVTNLKRYVFPYLDELEEQKNIRGTKECVAIIRTNIEQLISPISKTLASAYFSLTPKEIKVADLIRHGNSSKDISNQLNISISTVEKHRHQIREKMNISKKKVNLQTFLASL